MASNALNNGLDALRAEIGLAEIASLIERTARWVDPETFRLLPLWYPEHARRRHFYKENWTAPLTNTNRRSGTTIHKTEGNIYANNALTLALGERKATRPNWSCCHIWGIDDPGFQKSNDVVADRRFYSCVANMIMLPTPLKAFTDAMPEIKTMLRICAFNLYGWRCDHPAVSSSNAAADVWSDWKSYPESWPRSPGEKTPRGMVRISEAIRQQAVNRRGRIEQDLGDAGPFYPRTEVMEAIGYWRNLGIWRD